MSPPSPAGGGTGYALRDDGTVRAWGSNVYGQLGNGSTTTTSSTPVQVSGLTGVTAIAAGGFSGYTLRGEATPPDTTPPGPVSGVTVTGTTTSSVALSWTNLTDADLAGVLIRRAAGGRRPRRRPRARW
jgi:hypothetical protein